VAEEDLLHVQMNHGKWPLRRGGASTTIHQVQRR
jgi:hypothetical protein